MLPNKVWAWHRLQSWLMFYRSDNRVVDQLRPVVITPEFITTAEGSVLIEVGRSEERRVGKESQE